MEGHGPSWPPLLMEGHALSWPEMRRPYRTFLDAAAPPPKADATERIPPDEAEGSRSAPQRERKTRIRKMKD